MPALYIVATHTDTRRLYITGDTGLQQAKRVSALLEQYLMEEVDWSEINGHSLTFPTFFFCFVF